MDHFAADCPDAPAPDHRGKGKTVMRRRAAKGYHGGGVKRNLGMGLGFMAVVVGVASSVSVLQPKSCPAARA
eukprot:7866177-Prorocentrum_lima.AAC.1